MEEKNPTDFLNERDNNRTHFAVELWKRNSTVVFLESATFFIMFIAALVGNCMICVAMYRNPGLRKITNTFILGLAVSDLAFACFCMPTSLGILIRGKWVYPFFVCKFQSFFIYTLVGISLYTMTLTSVNRYYRVVKPGKYGGIFTSRSTTYLLGLVWFINNTVILILLLVGWLHPVYQPEKASCVLHVWLGKRSWTSTYQVVAFLLFFILPSSVVLYCYRAVSQAVKAHRLRTAGSLYAWRSRSDRAILEEANITRTLFAVIFGFALCWTPVILYEVTVISANMLGFAEVLPRSFHLIWLYFGSLSSALNAFIYGGMNKAFRSEFFKILSCTPSLRVSSNHGGYIPENPMYSINKQEN